MARPLPPLAPGGWPGAPPPPPRPKRAPGGGHTALFLAQGGGAGRGTVGFSAWVVLVWPPPRRGPELIRPATLMLALVAARVTLGGLTVLTRRDVWINSFHVVCGALVLTTSLVLTLRSWRVQFGHDTVGLKADTTIDPLQAVGLKADAATASVRSV